MCIYVYIYTYIIYNIIVLCDSPRTWIQQPCHLFWPLKGLASSHRAPSTDGSSPGIASSRSLLVISAHLSEFLECNEGSSINLKPENCIPQHLTLATEECINVQRRSLISDSRIHHVFSSLDCHGVVPQRSVAVIYLTGPGNTVSRYISMSFVQLCWRSCKCDLLRI